MTKLCLPTVTLVAVTSVNVSATCAAMIRCLKQIEFGDCVFLSDALSADCLLPAEVRHVPIKRLQSSAEYSSFILRDLVEHITTEHVLIIQWDGFVLDVGAWNDAFCEYDYVGAPWPQFTDFHNVGNGGFSFRSKRLLEACRDPAFVNAGPEDVAICRINRALLEDKHGMRFAPRLLADTFAFERTKPTGPVFGFHGIFNMVEAIGGDEFLTLYSGLDEREAVWHDLWTVMRQLKKTGSAMQRLTLLLDWIRRKKGVRGVDIGKLNGT